MKHLTEEEIFNKLYEKGCFLLGQLFLDNDEIDYIINYTRNIIDLDENFINESADLILSVGLVIIAANDYQDGNYWGFLQLKLKIDKLSPLKQGIIGRKFLNTLEEYELFQLSKNENGMNRYVENIKAHAFVTDNYMNGYYDFLFDYYEKNLFRDISLEVEDTLQDLSDYMKTTLDQNDDIVYSNNLSDMKTKSYKLLKSTREVIAQCDGKSLLELFYTSLKIIDRNFYDGIIPNENEGRFAKGFINWNNNKQLSKEYKKDKESNLRNNNLKHYIEMHNGSEFYLIIPKRRFRMSSNGNISVNVAINGLILKNELEVSINMGTYISEEINEDIEPENIFYSKMIEEFGEMLKFLRNENIMLKATIDEKSQILQNFQNVTQEAKKKIDKLIEDNENLLNENKQMKEQLKKLNEQKKEEEKKENMQMKNELCSLKNELNTVQNYFTNQLKRKECCINDLKKNYDNLESQYQQTLKQTLNNCSNSQNTYRCNNSYINNCNNSYIPDNNMNRVNLDYNKNYNCSNILPKCINDLNNCG